MGMDVYGKNPTSETGKYFRNNVWWWRPLAGYVCEIAPQITAKCEHWQSNDGDGLDADSSVKLAAILREHIASGKTRAYADIHAAELTALPDKECWLCEGTGIRKDQIGVADGQAERIIDKEGHPRNGEKGWCNGCDGVGHVRPDATHYPFSVENVEESCSFLEACGGFEIN
jgi:hypothetical protein